MPGAKLPGFFSFIHSFMYMRKILLTISALCVSANALFAQSDINQSNTEGQIAKSIFNPKYSRTESNKGKIFFHWGYNFSSYAKSDIHFTGPGYDFTIHDVKASDRPTKLSMTYINPAKLTIPQFNFHFGYFIKDNYSISIGWDHMKYVVDIPQTVRISGYINEEISNPGIPTGGMAGTYNGEQVTLVDSVLTFEHTDGYNFASIDIERYDDIWVSRSGKQYLTMETGIGVGLLVPRSDVRLFGEGKNHYWNIAGYGAAAKVGAQFHFNKWLYLQTSLKGGWTDLNKIRTTGRNNLDKASQQIWFLENYWVLGFRF